MLMAIAMVMSILRRPAEYYRTRIRMEDGGRRLDGPAAYTTLIRSYDGESDWSSSVKHRDKFNTIICFKKCLKIVLQILHFIFQFMYLLILIEEKIIVIKFDRYRFPALVDTVQFIATFSLTTTAEFLNPFDAFLDNIYNYKAQSGAPAYRGHVPLLPPWIHACR